jgi:hypothetical protein
MICRVDPTQYIDELAKAGVSADDAWRTVRGIEGEAWIVDVAGECVPRFSGLPPATPASGPGTELSKLLKRFGINPTPTCQCRAKQQQMDQWGCDECSRPERIEEVVTVMREEAAARGLPFLDLAGRMLVKRAIQNARRNA